MVCVSALLVMFLVVSFLAMATLAMCAKGGPSVSLMHKWFWYELGASSLAVVHGEPYLDAFVLVPYPICYFWCALLLMGKHQVGHLFFVVRIGLLCK